MDDGCIECGGVVAQALAAAERLARWALALARLMQMEVDSKSPWKAKLRS